jgi:succinylglutamic semialdehyde dehydrogenase
MGGNNPIIVWDTTDLHSAAVIVVQSAFLSAGQRCTAARRLIVKDSLYDVLVSEVKRLADRLVIGDPHGEPAPFMGPVIDNNVADGLTESFLALMSHGGKPIKHMARPIPGRPFVTPGIIDVTQMTQRPDIELFGPLLQVISVPDFEAAIDEANNTMFGLSASLIGGAAQQYDQFWANSRAGIVNWNAPTNGAASNAPFGGVGISGNHRPGAYYAADYCAYPVVSAENELPKAMIGIGLKDDDFATASGDQFAK